MAGQNGIRMFMSCCAPFVTKKLMKNLHLNDMIIKNEF